MVNGILVMDKSEGWTSHDVVAKLRSVLGERRVGHAGTLDPMATGVLPVFVGRATRAVEFAAVGDKEYIAGLRLGEITDTQDITGNVLERRTVEATREQLVKSLEGFRGNLMQLPPMYSAIKQNGKKLYELARTGKEVERTPRPVTIYKLELEGQPARQEYLLRVVCSKGTYVRTLCHDIGQALGCGGVMCSLRRVRAAGFQLEQAVTMDALLNHPEPRSLLLPVDTCFMQYPALTIDGRQLTKARNGAAFSYQAQPGLYRVYDADGGFLLLGRVEQGVLSTIKSFFEV